MQPKTEQLIRESIRGVSEVSAGSRGLNFDRLPAWTKPHHQHDGLTGQVAAQGSGVRLELLTSATEIALTYRSLRDNPQRPSVVTAVSGDHEVSITHTDGDLRLWSIDGTFEFVAGVDSVAIINLPPAATARAVSIWLPHDCAIEIIDLSADAEISPATNKPFTWLHYGSSISHCVEANEPTGVWPSRVAIDLGLNLVNLGLAGSANIEYFAAKTIATTPADLITLKLGINVVAGATMTRRTFVPAVQAMLDIISKAQPEAKIVVISPIYCPGLETQPGPALTTFDGKVIGSEYSGVDWVGELTLSEVRELLAGIVRQRADSNLCYLDGLELFREGDVDLMPDHLHPNAEGYLLMAERAKRLLFSDVLS